MHFGKTVLASGENSQKPSEIHSLDQFNEMYREYVRQYNTTIHSSIKCPPLERYERTKDYIRKPRSQEWLDECFLNRIRLLYIWTLRYGSTEFYMMHRHSSSVRQWKYGMYHLICAQPLFYMMENAILSIRQIRTPMPIQSGITSPWIMQR